MIELLILHELCDKTLTMYGISEGIKSEFSSLLTPSYGTIRPALTRLEDAGFLKTKKNISPGGRLFTYYSITKPGIDRLRNLLLTPPVENPVKFLPAARVKLYCAGILEISEQKQLFKLLKIKAENIMLDTKKLLEENSNNFFPKMVYDNLTCEYKNFISLLEGLDNACKN